MCLIEELISPFSTLGFVHSYRRESLRRTNKNLSRGNFFWVWRNLYFHDNTHTYAQELDTISQRKFRFDLFLVNKTYFLLHTLFAAHGALMSHRSWDTTIGRTVHTVRPDRWRTMGAQQPPTSNYLIVNFSFTSHGRAKSHHHHGNRSPQGSCSITLEHRSLGMFIYLVFCFSWYFF